jgi:serine O-acetyltransferase
VNAYHLYWVEHRLYRLGVPVLPGLIRLLIYLLTNSFIPYTCTIGTATRFGYGGMGVVIHEKATIGRGVLIGPQVTIGGRAGEGPPTIEDHVYLATGAKILGSITVGEGSIVGANAVVLHSVPPYSIVAGVPARVIATDIDPTKHWKPPLLKGGPGSTSHR